VAGADLAPLPPNYETAVAAMKECDRVDQCLEWRNKAEALRSYARQVKDHWLRTYAMRIKARAYRRMGELLAAIPKGEGGRDGKRRDGTVRPLNRTQAASAAGLSERERRAALRIAAVNPDMFERAVESDDPPSVSALAALASTTSKPQRRPRKKPKPPRPGKLETMADLRPWLDALGSGFRAAAFDRETDKLPRPQRDDDIRAIDSNIGELLKLREVLEQDLDGLNDLLKEMRFLRGHLEDGVADKPEPEPAGAAQPPAAADEPAEPEPAET
jgi:hypothetical protein